MQHLMVRSSIATTNRRARGCTHICMKTDVSVEKHLQSMHMRGSTVMVCFPQDWFKTHKKCPVPECTCECNIR